jgi:hypothetical protein
MVPIGLAPSSTSHGGRDAERHFSGFRGQEPAWADANCSLISQRPRCAAIGGRSVSRPSTSLAVRQFVTSGVARVVRSMTLNENPNRFRHDWRVEIHVLAVGQNQLKRVPSRRQADGSLSFAVAKVNDLIADGERLVERTQFGIDEKMMMPGIGNRCRGRCDRHVVQADTYGERRKDMLTVSWRLEIDLGARWRRCPRRSGLCRSSPRNQNRPQKNAANS